MTLQFSAIAERELAEALAYFEAPYALALAQRVQAKLDSLDQGGFDGQAVTFKSGKRVRRWVVDPLIVYYERRGDILYVHRIRHGRRRPITR